MQARLIPIANRLGITKLLKKYPYELSGGQKQRAAAARAIITNPKLILADEPTGSLDSVNREEIKQLFKRLRDEYAQTIVIVTHDDSLAEIADRVVKMRDGEIVEIINNKS